MSTRLYPLYQRGNPQLRVFLPNFWLKIVRPDKRHTANTVLFQCSIEMTKFDIRNYLEKIYNVPVVDVRTHITLGKLKRNPGAGYVTKGDDIKYAYVTLPKNMTFEYPDIFAGKKEDEEDSLKSLDEAKSSFRNYLARNKDRPNLPSWFSL